MGTIMILSIAAFGMTIAFSSYIIGGIQFLRLIILLKQRGTNKKELTENIKREINSLPYGSSLNVSICINPGYDASIGRRTINISSKWLVDFLYGNYPTLYDFSELYITICHEIGHYYYNDGFAFKFSPKQRLISRLKEIRADLFARDISEYSKEKFSDIMENKINMITRHRGQDFYSDHPSWDDRLYCVKNFDDYESSENEIKALCKKDLLISKSSLNNITLISKTTSTW